VVAAALIPGITRTPQDVTVGPLVLQKECYMGQRKIGLGLRIPSIKENTIGHF